MKKLIFWKCTEKRKQRSCAVLLASYILGEEEIDENMKSLKDHLPLEKITRWIKKLLCKPLGCIFSS